MPRSGRAAGAAALALAALLGGGVSHAAAATTAAAKPVVNDFDGDGRSDLVDLGGFGRPAVDCSGGNGGDIGRTGGDPGQGWDLSYRDLAAPGDLDGDGVPDVLAATPGGQLRIYSSALHETGWGGVSGTYDPTVSPTVVGPGWNVYSKLLSPGDLNADGRPDLLARDHDGGLWFYAGTGSATAPFRARVRVGTAWNMYDQVLGAGDFDGNGYGDVIARDVQGRLWLYPGVGNGRLGARRQIGTGWQIFNQIIGDVDWNGDGHLDLLARTFDGRMWFYAGDGHGGYSSRVPTVAGPDSATEYAGQGGLPTWGKNNLVGHLANGHFAYYYANNDGTLTRDDRDPFDGFPELESAKRVTNPVSLTDEGNLSWVYQNAYDNLIPPSGNGVVKASSYSVFFGPGDLTGDGRSDLVVRDTGGGLYVLPGDGHGSLGARKYVGPGWNVYNRIVGAGDLTGDGRTDILATTPGGSLYLYPGRGDGTFAARKLIGPGWNIYGKLAAPGDLNGDGKADLVGVDSAGRLWSYSGTGASAFGARREIGTAGWNGFSELS
jgi:hypothetical protein